MPRTCRNPTDDLPSLKRVITPLKYHIIFFLIKKRNINT